MSPEAGDHVPTTFSIVVDATDAVSVTYTLDNNATFTSTEAPFTAKVTEATPGPHVVSITATAVTGAIQHQILNVTVDASADPVSSTVPSSFRATFT